MNKTIGTMAAATITLAGLVSCATSKQRPSNNTHSNTSQVIKMENIDNDYLTLSDAQSSALQGINGFGLNLMRTQTGMDSKIVSPLSVSFLMGMLANGAEGSTRTEIMQTLGVESTGLDALNETCKALIDDASKQKSVKISIADCIAVNKHTTIKTDYANLMKAMYSAEVSSRDFEQTSTLNYINNWCSKKTNGMISRIIDSLSPNDVAVLMNAVYFNGMWKNKFDKSETRLENFRGYTRDIKRVKMMHANGKRMYAEMDGYRAVTLPYTGDDYAMTIILPNEDRSVSDVINTLDTKMIESMQSRMDECQVDIKLPRFTIATETSLNKPVAQLGAPSMFSAGKANFSNMTSQSVFVSTMLQKARIEVTEEGTKAAAVTAATMMTTSLMPSEPRRVVFHVDRPFIYMITHIPTGAIFFIGQYTGDDL